MNERLIELAEQAGYMPDQFGIGHWDMPECKRFAELVRQDERDRVFRALDSDLEHGVKCLSEKAAAEFMRNYPNLNRLLNEWVEHERED